MMVEQYNIDELVNALMDLRLKGKINDMLFRKEIIKNVEIQIKITTKDTRPCFCGAELEDISEIYSKLRGTDKEVTNA